MTISSTAKSAGVGTHHGGRVVVGAAVVGGVVVVGDGVYSTHSPSSHRSCLPFDVRTPRPRQATVVVVGASVVAGASVVTDASVVPGAKPSPSCRGLVVRAVHSGHGVARGVVVVVGYAEGRSASAPRRVLD